MSLHTTKPAYSRAYTYAYRSTCTCIDTFTYAQSIQTRIIPTHTCVYAERAQMHTHKYTQSEAENCFCQRPLCRCPADAKPHESGPEDYASEARRHHRPRL
jgi:hypothetical protein